MICDDDPTVLAILRYEFEKLEQADVVEPDQS